MWGRNNPCRGDTPFRPAFSVSVVAASETRSAQTGNCRALILVMRLIDLFWMLAPAFTGEHFHMSWLGILLYIVAPIAIGGLWLSMFAWELSKRSLIPINDPQYESVLEQTHAGH